MRKKEVEPTERDLAILAYRRARNEYYDALEKLNWADDDMFDIANEELTVALHRYNVEAKKIKLICGKLPEDEPKKRNFFGKKLASKITS